MPSLTKIQSGFLDESTSFTIGNNLNIGQNSSALQSAGTGITIYGTSNSEIKFLNSTTGSLSTDGTALVSSGLDFTLNNRETGNIILGTNNTERLRVDSSGNLLAGTTSNLGYPGRVFNLKGGQGYVGLSVSDTEARVFNTWDTTGIPLTFYMGGSERMRIDASTGNVGIGTSNPSVKLHVSGNEPTTTTQFTLTQETVAFTAVAWSPTLAQTNNANTIQLISSGKFDIRSDGSPAQIRFYLSGRTNTGYQHALIESNTLVVGSYDKSNSGTTNSITGTISGPRGSGTDIGSGGLNIIGGESTGSASGGPIIFSTSTAGSSGSTVNTPTERVRITSTGNVGIGVTSPSTKLSVNGQIAVNTTGSATSPVLTKSDDLNTGIFFPAADTIAFAAGGTEVARFDSTARLLIGTSSVVNDNIEGAGYSNLVQIQSSSVGAGLAVRNTTNVSRINIVRLANLATNTEIGSLSFGSEAGPSVERAKISAFTNTTGGTGGRGGELRFYTTSDGAAGNTERLRIDNLGKVLISKTGDNVSNSYGLRVDTSAYSPNDSSGPHFGIQVRQNGARYALNYGVYSEIAQDSGFFNGGTVDGLTTVRGIGVYGYTPCASQAYQKAIGVYGKAEQTDWNYNTVHGVRGLAIAGSSTFSTNSSMQFAGVGGHFVAYGRASTIGVYADAYLSATAGNAGSGYGPERARPLVIATNGTELFTVESNGNLKAGNHSKSVIATSEASAYTIYISDAGNDTTGDGSSALPYRSLSKAFTQVPKLILTNSVSIIILGSSYTMTAPAYLYGCHGGGVRSNANTKVYIYCNNGASTPIAMSGYGIEISDCTVPIEIFQSTWNIPAAGGGFSINRCSAVALTSSVTVNSDSTTGWSVIFSVNSCNAFSSNCVLNVGSSSVSGLGGLIVISNTSNASWGGNIIKSGTKYGNTAISVVNNSYISTLGCTIQNFATGLYLGANHYNAETGAHGIVNSTTFDNCTTGISVANGSTYRNYAVTFTNCTTNVNHQASTGANGYMGGQAVRGLFGYSATQNDTYYLQVNSQIFATSATIATSDGRFKEEVVPITDGIDIIKKLNPVEFKWKEHQIHNFDIENKTVGFIAQEVQEALSDKSYVNSIVKQNAIEIESGDIESVEITPPTEAVFDEDGNLVEPATLGIYEEVVTKEPVTEEFLGIAEGNMIAILTAALKEAVERIENLEQKIQDAGI